MPSAPQVTPLSRFRRRLVFWSFLLIFCISMPALWFYTTGYRFQWKDTEGNTIVGVGGLYISSDVRAPDFFVDEKQITNFRIFRKAAYIQDLTEGVHSVHVQGEGVQTWTKNLPVYSYIVTEAYAFLMPAAPQIRVISEYTTATGTAVLYHKTSTSSPFSFASSTNLYVATSSRATTTLSKNSEYMFVKSLFASSTAPASRIAQIASRIELPLASRSSTTTTATTTKRSRDLRLFLEDNEVHIAWEGSDADRPHYFCVGTVGASSTAKFLGAHVYEDIVHEAALHHAFTDMKEASRVVEGARVCRDSIRIDRKGKKVLWFDFLPSNPELVLMHLEDGLYVVEADDRAWQNTQVLYPGTDLAVSINGGRIYVRDRGYFVEVFTALPQ